MIRVTKVCGLTARNSALGNGFLIRTNRGRRAILHLAGSFLPRVQWLWGLLRMVRPSRILRHCGAVTFLDTSWQLLCPEVVITTFAAVSNGQDGGTQGSQIRTLNGDEAKWL